MASLTWNQEQILFLLISTFLYGVYSLTFGMCIYSLGVRKSESVLRRRLFLVAVALFLSSTAQEVSIIWSTFATIDSPDSLSCGDNSGAAQEINNYNLGNTIGYFIITFSNFVADGLLIWRCYVLWNRRFLVISVPLVLLIAETLCGFAMFGMALAIYYIRLYAPADDTEPPLEWLRLNNALGITSIAFYASSCVTNLMMSGLIAFRIWRSTRYVAKTRSRNGYIRVASLIFETGILYSVCLLLGAIFVGLADTTTMEAASTGYGVMTCILQQIVGIFPTVIILLVALGRSSEQTTHYSVNAVPRKEERLTSIQFAEAPTPVESSDATESNAIQLELRRTESRSLPREK
ncbi:hypothetical protein OE88DRAFT_1663091 [Heliocybe sulcata]|uniref:Uncharacterized protein n=1 Tax=Heliocybe sulcata TaxID=5364 RepID=A0A5C3MVX8_9AGAM|nr:hypothetical protein OE88DRAFT_1663091 [Heliocybe sulcata]